jgi:hypothetical protein
MPATNDFDVRTDRSSHQRYQLRQDAAMTRPSEILFIDPAVPDIDVLLSGVRSGVEVIVLDAERPAARQLAPVLADRPGLDAIHIVAHGAPGCVSFAGGEWSAATLAEQAEDLAAIGGALGPDGDLRLWSCHTGAHAVGASFVEALARAAGAEVAAASGIVGRDVFGSSWELFAGPGAAVPRPPLTAAGIESYAGVLALEITVTGTLPNGNTTGVVTHFVVDRTKGAIVGQVVLPDAARQNNSVSLNVKVPGIAAAFAIGTFDDAGNFQESTFLRVNNPVTDNKPATGAVGQ